MEYTRIVVNQCACITCTVLQGPTQLAAAMQLQSSRASDQARWRTLSLLGVARSPSPS